MADVKYTFSASGYASVQNAFKSIDSAAAKSSRVMGNTSRESIRHNRQMYQAQRRAAIQYAKQIAKIEKEAARQRLRQEKEVSRRIEAQRKENATIFRGLGAGVLAGGIGLGVGAISSVVSSITSLASKAFDKTKQATFESISLQDRAVRLAIQGGSPGNRMDPTAVRKQLELTASNVKGQKAADIAEGVGAFVTKTGDLKKALDFSQTFAEISQATGASVQDIGSAAADLFLKFDVSSVEDMSKAFSVLAVQGKRGNFELSDFAEQIPEIGAAAARYGLKGAAGVAQLGGLAQIAKSATGSGAEAATSIAAMFRQLIAKSGDIGTSKGMAKLGVKGAKGVQVFKDEGKTITRDISDVITEVIADAGGNLDVLQQIFDARGIKAVSPLITTFNDVKNKTVGPESVKIAAGMKAMREQIAKATAATGAEAEIKEDLALSQKRTATSMDAAWESFVSKVGENIAPAVAKIIEDLSPIVDEIDFGQLGDDIAELGSAVKDAAEYFGFFQKEDPNKAIKRADRQEKDLQKKIEPFQKIIDSAGGDALGALGTQKYQKYMDLRQQIADVQAERSIAENKLDRGNAAQADLTRLGVGAGTAKDITGRIYKDQGAAQLSDWEKLRNQATNAFLVGGGALLGGGIGAAIGQYGANKNASATEKELAIRQSLASNIQSDTKEIRAESKVGPSTDLSGSEDQIKSIGDAASKAAKALSEISSVNIGSIFAGLMGE